MKIVLAGSPTIALKTFEKIINHFQVLAIVTNQDKAQGRGLKVQATPVAELGNKYGIEVFKTNNIDEITTTLKNLNFDLFLTFAFGQYIPEQILTLGSYKALNIHGSLLPKYRGAAPIQYAILNGDKEIGISLIEMIDKMDAGNIYFSAKKSIDDLTTSGEAMQIISDLAANNIIDWLNKIKINQVKPYAQGQNFSLCPKITKAMANLNLNLSAYEATRKIRAFNPAPGAFIILNNKRLKIFDIRDQNFVKQKNLKQALPITFANQTLWAVDFQWENKKRINLLEKNV